MANVVPIEDRRYCITEPEQPEPQCTFRAATPEETDLLNAEFPDIEQIVIPFATKPYNFAIKESLVHELRDRNAVRRYFQAQVDAGILRSFHVDFSGYDPSKKKSFVHARLLLPEALSHVQLQTDGETDLTATAAQD